MLPTIEELVEDAPALARELRRGVTVRDWADWYGVQIEEMQGVLEVAVWRGALQKVSGKTGDGYVAVGAWQIDALSEKEAKVYEWLEGRQQTLVQASKGLIAKGVGRTEEEVWGVMCRLMAKGVVEKVSSTKGRGGNEYRVMARKA